MSYVHEISPLHLDVLKEFGNIGAGNAATALSKLLNKKVDMKVPNVRVVSLDEMIEMAGGAEKVVACVFFRVEGDAPGSMFYVLSLKQAELLIGQMIDDESFQFNKQTISELAISALQELGNILAGSYLSSLSDFTQLNLYASVPALSIEMAGALISIGLMEVSQVGDFTIVIDTQLNEGNSQSNLSVNGHFFLLPDPSSFPIIFQALGVSMDDGLL